MKQAKIAYKSGNVVKVNFTDDINLKHKNGMVTDIQINGIYGADQPVFWGLENVESIVISDVGWQAPVQYVLNLFTRVYYVIKGAFSGGS